MKSFDRGTMSHSFMWFSPRNLSGFGLAEVGEWALRIRSAKTYSLSTFILGQTEAVLALASGLSASYKQHHVAQGVGHYGIFNGRVFRTEIYLQVIKPFLMQK